MGCECETVQHIYDVLIQNKHIHEFMKTVCNLKKEQLPFAKKLLEERATKSEEK